MNRRAAKPLENAALLSEARSKGAELTDFIERGLRRRRRARSTCGRSGTSIDSCWPACTFSSTTGSSRARTSTSTRGSRRRVCCSPARSRPRCGSRRGTAADARRPRGRGDGGAAAGGGREPHPAVQVQFVQVFLWAAVAILAVVLAARSTVTTRQASDPASRRSRHQSRRTRSRTGCIAWAVVVALAVATASGQALDGSAREGRARDRRELPVPATSSSSEPHALGIRSGLAHYVAIYLGAAPTPKAGSAAIVGASARHPGPDPVPSLLGSAAAATRFSCPSASASRPSSR